MTSIGLLHSSEDRWGWGKKKGYLHILTRSSIC